MVSGTYQDSRPNDQGGGAKAAPARGAGNVVVSRANDLISAALALLITGLIASTLRFWQTNGPLLLPSGSYALVPCAILVILAALKVRVIGVRTYLRHFRLTPHGSAVGIIAVVLSDWLDRSYNFFPAPFVRGEIILLGSLFLLLGTRVQRYVLTLVLPLTILFLGATFLLEGGGRLLFSDDHPSFFFRLSMLKERFPFIPFYYPGWNAGLDARDFFATGALSGYLLFAPLLYLFDLRDTYNLIIALILFGLLPLSLYVTASLEGADKIGRALAATLALCCGLVWYRWALKYGTIGFVISTTLTPLNLALSVKLLRSHPIPSKRHCALFVLSMTLMLLWSASALVFVPFAALALFSMLYRLGTSIRPVFTKRALLTAVALVLINLPWMTIFWSVSNVGKFLTKDSATSSIASSLESSVSGSTQPLPQEGAHRGFRHRDGSLDIGKSIGIVREKSFSTNPLILFLALPGLFLLETRSRIALIGTGVWLLFLGSILVPIKPQLELDRMLLVLTVIASVPAGLALRALLLESSGLPRIAEGALRLVSAGTLLAAPFCTAAILSNRTVEQYHFTDTLVPSLVDAIKQHGGAGRTVFSGCVVHELEEGHLAPLPLWTGKEIVASAPFHTLWKYTQVVPKSFIERSDQGIEEYLSLMNATSVVAHEREWREYFLSRPDLYRLAWREDRFSLFERLNFKENVFAEGSGILLEKSTHSLTFRVDTPSAVVKYNYFPFLKASGCTISAAQVAPEIRLIRLDQCTPGEPVTIESRGAWWRVFS